MAAQTPRKDILAVMLRNLSRLVGNSVYCPEISAEGPRFQTFWDHDPPDWLKVPESQFRPNGFKSKIFKFDAIVEAAESYR
ncbi:hypothetical protein ACTXT7_015062 [Hymenolepis weldensis]